MLCPLSGTAGRPVELATVKALVTEAALRRITAAPHAFCADSACGTVYFAADGSTFSTDDIRVPVWQKQRGGNRMICYCFAESEDSIRREVLATGHTHAIERIRAHIAAGRCACELRNPRGSCCLGDIRAAVQRISRTIHTNVLPGDTDGRVHGAHDVSDR
jgi:hypothetical protein